MVEMKDLTDMQLQDVAGTFVEMHIQRCQSVLVDGLLQKGVFNYEDIQNLYIDNSEKITELEKKRDKLGEQQEEEKTEARETEIYTLTDDINELTEEQETPQEIYEWWLVDNWLLGKLKELGEPILDNDYGEWWGRCCTGQAILLDYNIQKLAVQYLGGRFDFK